MNGKVVIITGGVSGIGRSTAIAFARKGPTVVIGDFDKTGGEKTHPQLRIQGGDATFMRVDFSCQTSGSFSASVLIVFPRSLMNSRGRPLYRPVVFVDD
jgi:NAD(P)-dependent dehydrogenase (short-subunit alcohol dehydrogenase family)